MTDFTRLLSPRRIAVIGGGSWCENVVRECRRAGFSGELWPVHPKKDAVAGVPAYPGLDRLPGIPDAAFVGVNRVATVDVVAHLARLGCGGAVCFAAGFKEAGAELADGADLQDHLVAAAGPMRLLGPNCYGFVNAFDGVALWPDMHGLDRPESGVAIIGQSSNVLINLTMQRRGLPLGCVVAVGNQAQSTMGDIGLAMLEDPRITALGLHIEGITDLAAFVRMAARAQDLGKGIVALKVGRSVQAQAATISHTASITGSDAGGRALLERLGIAQVDSPEDLVETLKLLHCTGGLASARIVSASCSGGEASLMADLGLAAGVTFPPLEPDQAAGLRAALGPKVALANPLDYNTYIWGDAAAMTRCFSAMLNADIALGCLVIDYPRADRFMAPDWDTAVSALRAAGAAAGKPVALVSLLAEGMPETVAAKAIAQGIVPLCGMASSLAAIRAGSVTKRPRTVVPPLLPGPDCARTRIVGEAESKVLLATAGVSVPAARRVDDPAAAVAAAEAIGFPVVLKGEGIAHKTEAGAVVLGLRDAAAVADAARAMPAESFLVEAMVTGTVAELLVGVVRDPAHGFVMTLGHGGTLTELLADTASLLLPASEDDVGGALDRLRCAALLDGYRGKPAAARAAIVACAMAVQAFVIAHADRVAEVEINPLLCSQTGAVAADALIRMGDLT